MTLKHNLMLTVENNGDLEINPIISYGWQKAKTPNCLVQIFTCDDLNLTLAVMHTRLEHSYDWQLWLTGDIWDCAIIIDGNISQDEVTERYFFTGLNEHLEELIASLESKLAAE